MAPLCRLFKASFWQLMALAAVAANGGTWGDTAILVTNVGLAAAAAAPAATAAVFQATQRLQRPRRLLGRLTGCARSSWPPCWLPQVRNWPSSRGSVVGTMKASVGLSGACVCACCSSIF